MHSDNKDISRKLRKLGKNIRNQKQTRDRTPTHKIAQHVETLTGLKRLEYMLRESQNE